MSANMTLKIQGVKGESKLDKHKDEIDVYSFSWGASNASSIQRGSGGGTAMANFQDLSIIKYADTATPNLFLAVASGKHFDKATLYVMKSGGDEPVTYLEYDMETVYITGWQISDGANSDSIPTENVTLSFAKVKVTYTPQTEKGGKGSATPITWNIAENKKE